MTQSILYSFSYYKDYWGIQLSILFVSLIQSIVSLFAPFLFAEIIDDIVNRELSAFQSKFVLLVILQVVSILAGYIVNRMGIYLTRQINYSVKKKVTNQMLSIPPYRLKNYSSGKIQVLLSTDTVVPSNIISTIAGAFMTLCTIVGIAIVVFYLNWCLACVLLCTYPATIAVNRYYTSKLKASALQITQENDIFMGCTRQIAGQMTHIKVQNGSRTIFANYSEIAKRNKEAVNKHYKLMANNSLLINGINYVNYIAVTAVGIAFVLGGYMPIGLLVAFHTYSKNLSSALDGIVQLKARMQPSLVSVNRLMEVDEIYQSFLEEEKTKCRITDKIERIELKAVNFSFGEKLVLSGLTYTFFRGITGIKGTNGCGKTTLMNLLLKNYIPQEGGIYMNEEDNRNIQYTEIQKKISYVGTGRILSGLTIRENLLLFEGAERVSADIVTQMLMRVNLYHDIVKLPEGLDTQISDAFSLSSGQMQKLQIARAFLHEPDILLFDEAFTNLDAETKMNILQFIQDKYSDRIVIIISHHLEDFGICNQVFEM